MKISKVTDYAALNISQMFQFYFKEKFDVLRIIRLLVSSRYRRVRKMQLHLVLFSFIYLKRIIDKSFVSTAPTYGETSFKLSVCLSTSFMNLKVVRFGSSC